MEINLDERHVLEEVDGTNLDVRDVEARALLQVVQEFGATLRRDKVDFVVSHVF